MNKARKITNHFSILPEGSPPGGILAVVAHFLGHGVAGGDEFVVDAAAIHPSLLFSASAEVVHADSGVGDGFVDQVISRIATTALANPIENFLGLLNSHRRLQSAQARRAGDL
ncbi:MAG TPA: hypothetical protein VG722_04180 [Tepidisphaeraceae bacterium]|nr:hypothetical protein [Tepidisphaeraceae bacterium]